MEFKEKLKMLRIRYGYSYRTLAKAVGVSTSAVVMWEKGERKPKQTALYSLATALHCSVEYLMNDNAEDESIQRTFAVPVLGDVSAGYPMYAEENILDYEEIPLSWSTQGDWFALRIKGDSMKPRMQSGDVVIVRKQSTVDDGQIGVVLVNGDSATVKIVRKTPNGITLIPTNPDYQPLVFTNEQIANMPISIIGLVVELRVKYV